MRRRWVDDEDDLHAFEPRHLARGKRVYRDGYGPSVKLYMTDAAPSRRAVFDARAHIPHEARLTDAARRRCEDAREAMIADACSGWTYNKEPLAPLVTDAGRAREAWIRRSQDAWRNGSVRYDLDTTHAGNTTLSPRSDDEEDSGFEIATDPYARNYWSSVEAIRSGSPDNAARVEAAQRRMSMSGPNATAASVSAENRRYRPRDSAAAIADRESAYAEYCRRIESEWRR
jgi:hypothetical protein